MRKIFMLLIAILFLSVAYGQTPQQAYNLSGKSIAIEGYDPVSYFASGKAVKGQATITAANGGVVYQFSSAANKMVFLADPKKYQPQYGGWCAYAMGATGEKVEVDPETFKIVNGKLYLFYNRFFNNTLKSWNKDEAGLMKKADANWPKFYNQK